MDGVRVGGGGRAGGWTVSMAQSGTCSELPTPSLMSRTGFTVCIHRRAEAMVEFGVIRPVSSSLSCLAASLSRSTFGLSPLDLQGSEVGGEWVRGRRWVPWSRLSCGPDWGGRGVSEEKRETAAR